MLLSILEKAVLPPVSLLLGFAFGFLLRGRLRRAGRIVSGASAAVLVLMMVPWVSSALLRSLQTEPPLRSLDDLRADVIVVLAADFAPFAIDYGATDVGPLTAERLRYAAYLQRLTELPLLTSGGPLQGDAPSAAELMATSLQRDFRVRTRWIEGRSLTTRENAQRTAELLKGEGLERVLLVTHAWHMPRARRAFERAGLSVVPGPTAFRYWPGEVLAGLVPNARSMQESSWAVHEWIGRLWYRLTE